MVMMRSSIVSSASGAIARPFVADLRSGERREQAEKDDEEQWE